MKNKTRITSKLRNSCSDNCSMIFMLHAHCVNDLFKHIESNYAGFSTIGQWRDSPSIKKNDQPTNQKSFLLIRFLLPNVFLVY